MRRAYRILLALYPHDYRIWFEAEMLEAADRGSGLREVCGLAAGCAWEWRAKLTSDRVARGRALPDLRMMRPVGVSKQEWFGPCSSGTLR